MPSLDARRETTALLGLLAGYLALWTWLQGGLIDRFARQRPTRTHGFAAVSSVFFFRFVRLGVMAGVVYWWLFAYLHPWLFDRALHRPDARTRQRTRGVRVAPRGLRRVRRCWSIAANVAFDYTRIRMVVEDRRSAFGGLAAAVRFILRRPGAVAGLWCANALVFAIAVAAWALLAPGVVSAGAMMWLAFLAAQLFVLARLALKLHFVASQTALFQGQSGARALRGRPSAQLAGIPDRRVRGVS